MRDGRLGTPFGTGRLLRCLATLLAGLGMTAVQAQALEDIQWLSEEYAPFNYSDDGTPSGISVEILTEMWDRLGLEQDATDIRILPWARGYRIAQDDPTACLFATTVTEPRRELFTFVEPLFDVRIAIIGAGEGAPEINSIADLESFQIGVVRDDIGEHLLEIAGAESPLVRTDSARIMMRMLRGGRFDLVAYDADVARWTMREEGMDPADYADLLVLDETVMGIACHRDMEESLIAQLQDALDGVIDDGTAAEIIERYRPQDG